MEKYFLLLIDHVEDDGLMLNMAQKNIYKNKKIYGIFSKRDEAQKQIDNLGTHQLETFNLLIEEVSVHDLAQINTKGPIIRGIIEDALQEEKEN
jgi:hypothetical protein